LPFDPTEVHMNRLNFALSALMFATLAAPFAYAVEHAQDPKPAPHARKDSEKRKEPPPEAQKPASPIAIGGELDAALSLADPSGKTLLLKDLRGKPIVLHFFGTKAGSSAALVPRLAALQDAYAAKGVQVIAVDANADDFDAADPATLKRVEQWAAKNHVTRVLFDPQRTLADRLHATVNGHTFVVDGQGVLRYAGTLDDDPKGEHPDRANALVRSALDAVLAGKTPEHATATPVGDPIVREARHEAHAEKHDSPPQRREPPKKKDGRKPARQS
jgi:thiol-disulfide isomerase/thioredoxin